MRMLLKAMCAIATAAVLLGGLVNCAEPGLSLSISGPKEAVKAGSEVVIMVTLENTTDHVINLTNHSRDDDQ